MSILLELRQTRAQAWDAAKNYHANNSKDGRLSPEHTEAYDKMESEVIAMGKDIERLERQEAMAAQLNAITRPAVVAQPSVPKTGIASDDYAKNFWNFIRKEPPGIRNALSVGSDQGGGYLVPVEFEHTLIQSIAENNIMRQLARTIPTTRFNLRIPTVEARGSAVWMDEGAKIPTGDGTFGVIMMQAHKIGTIVKVTHELLHDSAFPIDSFLAQDFGRRFGTLEEEAFLVGDGEGKPTGLFNTAPVGATAASATQLTFDDVIELYHSLKLPYRNKAVFIANDQTIKALRTVKDSSGQFIWQPSVALGTPDTLLGRPVYVSGYVPQIAPGAKVMAFGDFNYFWIADRQGRTFERLNELFAHKDQVGFLSIQRVDGRLVLPEAVQVLSMGTK